MVYPQAIVARANSLKNSGVPDDIFKLDDLSVLVSGYLPTWRLCWSTSRFSSIRVVSSAAVTPFYRWRN